MDDHVFSYKTIRLKKKGLTFLVFYIHGVHSVKVRHICWLFKECIFSLKWGGGWSELGLCVIATLRLSHWTVFTKACKTIYC